LKSKRRQLSNLPSILSQISSPRVSVARRKIIKDLPNEPVEVQLSDELAESLRQLKPEGNLYRDRYRSLVERGVVEPRFTQAKKQRRYATKYVEKYDSKHWGQYYGK
jgi:nucleolar protein 53